jgi:hypothetical protein
MSTQRKIDSARANGAKSSGPTTEEGRKKSSMNALKHGLNARTPVLFNETDDEHAALLHSYVQDLQPVGAAEMQAVVDMVNAKWRQRHRVNIEAEMFEQQMEKQKKEVDAEYKSSDEVVEHTFAFRELSESRGLAMVGQMESRLKATTCGRSATCSASTTPRIGSRRQKQEKCKTNPIPRPSTNNRSATTSHCTVMEVPR